MEMGAEHVLRAVCCPHLRPLPGPISDGSDKNPDPGLVGCLAVCQSGLACGHLFNKQRSGGFPYLRVGFGWETGFLAPLVSKGCLGVVPINYQTLSLWL